ncbi:MAG TPA: NAD(P)/FAD-dependent oxidoreductase [Streptosporangiaceae bacterium]|jgi:2-polyprenyl-6-methoxyphenol hydroxylase-like FAD-dependent oxidoreductase|nr:NAD(P)/FAD-dependent oxidoreductase [Streptosporangiaceae bacterium]
MNHTAIVIGGGIAGPATAMALARAGLEPTVYEARPGDADGGGVMLTLAVNGIDALRAIDADTAAVAAGFPTPQITLRTHTGKQLGVTSTGGALADGTTAYTIRRADLYQALHSQAETRGITVLRGKRLVSAQENPGSVHAVFADGTEAEADILVGCDGVHSTVRRQIDPAAPAPSYAGLLTTGGYASGVTVPAAPGSYEMIFGKRAFFGYAAAPGGEVWWFVNLPQRREPPRGEAESISSMQWRQRFAEVYTDDAGPALELIAATPGFAPMTPIHTVPHLSRWHTDRMIVVGDAAHAPSPTSGQGASLSVEDAVLLAISLRDIGPAAAAFAHFETVRRPRVEKIIKAAARINSNKAPGPAGRAVRDLMLPVILRVTANAKSAREVYEHHVDWNEPASRVQEATRS